MRKRIVVAAVGSCVAGLVVLALVGGSTVAQALSYGHLNQIQKRILSGFVSSEIAGVGAAPAAVPAVGSLRSAGRLENYAPLGGGRTADVPGVERQGQPELPERHRRRPAGPRAGAERDLDRRQDPIQPNHLVASFNDYRRGDGNCYGAYQRGRGPDVDRHARPDGLHPRAADFGAARQYWQAGGDTSVAWDTKGNAYLSCQVFNRGAGVVANPDQSSALLVFRSTGNDGASWNFPGRPVGRAATPPGAGDRPLEDKQLLTVDNHAGSPFQDRVYVTWTEFAADGTAYIYEAYSSDYGETFSPRVLVSSDQRAVRPNTFGAADAARHLQREPVLAAVHRRRRHALRRLGQLQQPKPIRPAWQPDNRNQMLLARSTDGGATFARRSRSATTTTCPTAPPTRAARTRSVLRPGEGRHRQLDLPGDQLPVGRGQPAQPQPGRGHLRLLHQQPTPRRANGCVPAGFSAAAATSTPGVKTRWCLQQRHPGQRVQRRRRDLHRHYHRPAAMATRQPGARAGHDRPVLAVGGVHQRRQAGGLLLRPPVRDRRDDRLVGREPVRARATWRASGRTGSPPRPCHRRPSSSGSSTATTPA